VILLTCRWRRPVGEDFLGGVEIVEIIKATDEELEYIVAPKHVATRGDTLNCMFPSSPSELWYSDLTR
jgi:hypothetical protein